MTQEAKNNAIVLYDLGMERECVENAHKLYESTPELKRAFSSPVINFKKKQKLVELIFGNGEYPKLFVNFLKKMCEYREIDDLDNIFQAFYEYWDQKHHILNVKLWYAENPSAEEMAKIERFLADRYPGFEIQIKKLQDQTLLGGYILQVANEEYDRSYEGSIKQLELKLTGR